jgi:heat shock protein HslJ
MNKSTVQRLGVILFLCLAVGRGRASNQTSGEQVGNTHWRLVRLKDSPIVGASLQREAYLVLNSASRRVTGSGGCNQISGSYKLKGDQLTFGHMSVTMKACARGMETEKDFLAELGRAAKWKIEGPNLALIDAGGTVVARFERGPTKVNYRRLAKPQHQDGLQQASRLRSLDLATMHDNEANSQLPLIPILRTCAELLHLTD